MNCAITKLDVNDPNILVTYNNFVIQKVPYVVTRGPDKGKTKITTCCDRETFKKKFSELNMAVDNSRSWYILHRYLVQCERFVFQMFRESIVDYGDIFWVDMSENLANTPKDQCQDAHFNQRQSGLCCTVQIGADDNTLHYHFSDYNTHNISYTGAVFDHLYSLNKKTMVFRVKSDNCAEQFKSRYIVFLGFGNIFLKQITYQCFYFMVWQGTGRDLLIV